MSLLSPENEYFAKKVQNNCKKVLKNLHMSKKSSTFAAAFDSRGLEAPKKSGHKPM